MPLYTCTPPCPGFAAPEGAFVLEDTRGRHWLARLSVSVTRASGKNDFVWILNGAHAGVA